MAGHPMLMNKYRSVTTPTTPTTANIPPFFKKIIEKMDEETLRKYAQMVHDCYNNPGTLYGYVVSGQIYTDIGQWCTRIFDGRTCWNAAPPGTIVKQNCPATVIGFNTQITLYKECDKNGTWLEQSESNKSWVDYNSCIQETDINFYVNLIYVIGYWLSIIALLISLGIFLCFRTLQSTRTKIHMRLFSALTLNNILWIIWYNKVIGDVDVVMNNVVWCQILHVFVRYSMITTYLWMFCEALYLHMSLNVDNMALKWLEIIGWGISYIIVMAYIIVRYIYGKIDGCWMETSDTSFIITVPVLISLLTSFGFLVNVLRKLIKRLHPVQPNRIEATKKAVRAALIMIPLYGLHFLLMPLRPSPGSSFEGIYEVVFALAISLQGLCVAIIFCFTNHEVITAVKARAYGCYWTPICNTNSTDDIPMTGVMTGERIIAREMIYETSFRNLHNSANG